MACLIFCVGSAKHLLVHRFLFSGKANP